MNQPLTQVSEAAAQPRSHDHKAPSIGGAVMFRLKTLLFQGERALRNLSRERASNRGLSLIGAQLLAESSTPLASGCNEREASLVAGKIQNLRIAARKVDGLEIPANHTFSFWAQIGRPSWRKGYARGRELRQGCLIPTIGGGLCQLSNALYQCAVESGFQIIERHAHSQIVPGSAAELGMDATVFWNYVDLRFKSGSAFRIEASLAGDRLVVRFKGTVSELQRHPAREGILRREPRTLPLIRSVAAGHSSASCASCGVVSCFRNLESAPVQSNLGRTAYLVDEYWPEFDEFIGSHKQPWDVIGIPLDGKLFRKSRYRWNTSAFQRVRVANIVTLRRSFELRYAPPQGAARQKTLLKHDRKLARSLARLLTFDVTHVVVTQTLLPFLWSEGHLAARRFDVLMTRLPLDALQARLETARERHPESTTLGDFRAEEWMIAAERQALENAGKIITPNTEIASLFGARAVQLDWHLPKVPAANQPVGGNGVLFPASTLGRKGAYEVREAAKMLGLELTVAGRELEGSDFWRGIPTRRASKNLLHGIGLVVLPAYIEDKPRLLLRAAACGIPVIASEACGLGRVPGVVTLPAVDAGILAAAISSLLDASGQWDRTSPAADHLTSGTTNLLRYSRSFSRCSAR